MASSGGYWVSGSLVRTLVPTPCPGWEKYLNAPFKSLLSVCVFLNGNVSAFKGIQRLLLRVTLRCLFFLQMMNPLDKQLPGREGQGRLAAPTYNNTAWPIWRVPAKDAESAARKPAKKPASGTQAFPGHLLATCRSFLPRHKKTPKPKKGHRAQPRQSQRTGNACVCLCVCPFLSLEGV